MQCQDDRRSREAKRSLDGFSVNKIIHPHTRRYNMTHRSARPREQYLLHNIMKTLRDISPWLKLLIFFIVGFVGACYAHHDFKAALKLLVDLIEVVQAYAVLDHKPEPATLFSNLAKLFIQSL